jgi:membrane-bound metal-dependent hydrolase YbcI (DUF457 family)
VNFTAGVTTAWTAWLVAAPSVAPAHPRDFALGFVVTAVASALPDVDHPGSTVGRVVPFHKVIAWVGGGHRMLFHSALAVAGVWWLTAWLTGSPTLALAAAVGYGAHLFTDVLTVMGIAIGYGLGLPFLAVGRVLEQFRKTRKIGKAFTRVGRALHRKTTVGWITTGSIHEERYVAWLRRFSLLMIVAYSLLVANHYVHLIDTEEVQHQWRKFSDSLRPRTRT